MALIMMQAITGDSVLLKFEKAKCALEDSLRRVEDIVPQSIGCQVILFSNMADAVYLFFSSWVVVVSFRFTILLLLLY